MRRTIKRLRLLAVLAVLLAVCLLATSGPASAGKGPAAAVCGTFVQVLDEGDVIPLQDGTLHTDGWVPLGVTTRVTGPEGYRFLGWAVMCLEVVEPPRGNNYHSGDVVFTKYDPRPPLPEVWDVAKTFWENLPDESTWLWKGTWDGVTLNKHNHIVHLALTGCGDNTGHTASVTWYMNLWTNVHMVAFVD